MEKSTLTQSEVLSVIHSLASSQGFYSRLWSSIQEADEDCKEEFLNGILATNPKDALDVVLYLEQ